MFLQVGPNYILELSPAVRRNNNDSSDPWSIWSHAHFLLSADTLRIEVISHRLRNIALYPHNVVTRLTCSGGASSNFSWDTSIIDGVVDSWPTLNRIRLEKRIHSMLVRFPAFYGIRVPQRPIMIPSRTRWIHSTLPSYFCKINFDITLPSRFSKQLLAVTFSHQNVVWIWELRS